MVKKKTSSAEIRRRKYKILLYTAAAAAFLLRLFTAYELGRINGGANSVFTPSAATDLCTYMRLAAEIAGGTYKGVFYYQPFYYAVFLPVIRWILGAGVWQVIIVQSLLGAGTALFAGLAGAMICGRRAGVIAAFLTAISLPLILYAPFHQNETLQTFNITLLLFLTLRAAKTRRKRYIFLSGLLSGIGILTRGNLWILMPVVLFAQLYPFRRKKKAFFTALLLFLLPLIAVQLPFVVHNSRLLGRISGPSTAADAVLALGNTWEAPAGGRNPGLPAGPMEYPEAYQRAMAKASEGISVPRQMVGMLLDSPAAFLELQWRKVLLFWDSREIPNNVSLYGEGRYSLILNYLFPGSSAVLLALGLAGMMLFLRKLFSAPKLPWLLLYGFITLYWAAVAAFYILSRFRAPILPVIAIAGGAFLSFYADSFRKDRRIFLRRSVFLLAAIWITSYGYDFYRLNCESSVMRLVRPEGTILPAQKGFAEVRLDYGPFTFGSWTPDALEPGTVLEKRFTRQGSAIIWQIHAETAGNMVCRITGKEAKFIQLSPGINELRFDTESDKIQLEILSVSPGISAIYDAQRNYARSSRNGKDIPGEWIVRLLVK